MSEAAGEEVERQQEHGYPRGSQPRERLSEQCSVGPCCPAEGGQTTDARPGERRAAPTPSRAAR